MSKRGEGEYVPTPEERKARALSDSALLRTGAEYDEAGNLIATKHQKEEAKQEMDMELMSRELSKFFSDDDMYIIVNALNFRSLNPNEQQSRYWQKENKKDKERTQQLESMLERVA